MYIQYYPTASVKYTTFKNCFENELQFQMIGWWIGQ